MMIKAILFDSDGVLVDSERLFFETTCTVFNAEGVTLASDQWARWYLGEGKRSRDVAGILGMEPSSIEATINRRDELFMRRVDQGVPVFPEVRETLTHLARHFRLAVVTGASRRHFERVHLSTGLGSFFEVLVSSDDCEQVKPHPQAYLVAMERLGLGPGECIAVEDSPRGATAAVAAGIPCFVIPTRLTDVTLCPPVCTFLEDIKQLIELTGDQ